MQQPAAHDRRSVAWVESPLQMISVVEAHHRGVLGRHTSIVPRAGVPTLDVTAQTLRDLGLPEGLHIADPQPNVPRTPDGMTFAVGDILSGAVQRQLLLAPPTRIVIVDDGLATVHTLERLSRVRPASLVRQRGSRGTGRHVLGYLAALLLRRRARNGRVTVCTALDMTTTLKRRCSRRSIPVLQHDFAWLRNAPAPKQVHQPTVVLGSSLPADGLIDVHDYLQWLLAISAEHSAVAYFPHRREHPAVLDAISHDARLAGISVVGDGVPVEVSLRGLGVHQQVIGLPSTALVSLRSLLQSSRTRVHTVPVPEAWWTPRATAEFRARAALAALPLYGDHDDTGTAPAALASRALRPTLPARPARTR